MIVNFSSRGAEDIFDGVNSPASRRRCPAELHNLAQQKLVLLDKAEELRQLAVPPGNRLELLRGDLRGWHSIRINSQWRIIFRWASAGPEGVDIVDYHPQN